MAKIYVLSKRDEDIEDRRTVGVVTVAPDKMAEYMTVLIAVDPRSEWHADAAPVLTITAPEPTTQQGVALPSYAVFGDCAACSTAIRWMPSQARWEHTATNRVACAPGS